MRSNLSFVMLRSLKTRQKKFSCYLGVWKGDQIDQASLGQPWTGLSPHEAPSSSLSNHSCQPSAWAAAATVCVITASGSIPQTHTYTCKNTHLSPQLPGACWTALQSAVHICVCVHTKGDKTVP